MEVVIKGSKSELMSVLEDAEETGSLPWRHGRRVVLVFPYEGLYLRTTIDVHPEEGWQIYDSITGTVVRKVEKTITVWEETP